MARVTDEQDESQWPSTVLDSPHERTGRPPTVLVVDADDALFSLIEEWLSAEGYRTILRSNGGGPAAGDVDLVVVDIPFPRQGGLDVLKRIAREHPGAPVVALSSSFFAGIGSSGAVARDLSVAGALPKPFKRDALIAAIRSALPTSG